MDAVITYVDGSDALWIQDYASVVGGEALTKRFRDWGTLKYLLRGIEKHIPSINQVFLVVSRESQVPDWVDRNNVKVVLHRDIIPERFLPLFNSSALEMYLHKIPGLSEEYLFFNDDMFPVMDCSNDDFFVEGKSAIGFRRNFIVANGYKSFVKNSDRQARLSLGKKPGFFFIRPQHTVSPMLKSSAEEVYDFSKDRIFQVMSPLRRDDNFNQYLFLDYMFFKGLTVKGGISNKHLTPAVHGVNKICSYIEKPRTKLICINDVQMPQKKFEYYRDRITSSFEKHFPQKSRFEK